jgi:hypothetical protein
MTQVALWMMSRTFGQRFRLCVDKYTHDLHRCPKLHPSEPDHFGTLGVCVGYYDA